MNVKRCTTLLISTLFLATSAKAIYFDRGEVPRSSIRVGTDTGRPAPIDATSDDSVATGSTTTLTCNKHTIENHLSLGFLYNLVDNPNDIRLTRTSRGTVILQIPKHISACLDLGFSFRNVENGRAKIMAMKNEFRFTPENTGMTAEELAGKTHDEKYAACLKEKGLLEEMGPNQYRFNRAAAEDNHHVDYSVETEFELGVSDNSQSMQFYFASPKANSYQTMFPSGNDRLPESPAAWPCLETERFMADTPYLYISDEDRLAERAQIACESENYEQIFRELSNLRRSTVGNANELISILESALDAARDKRLEEIYTRLEDIEREFAPTREDIAEGRRTGVSESRARGLANEYSTLLSEVNRILYDPSIQEINRLNNELEGADVSDERRNQIYDRITDLTEQIGRFARKDQRNLGRVFDGLREFGLNREALRIEGFRLKSLHFSRVHPDRNRGRAGERPITIEQANENVERNIASFETRVLTAWDDEQRVRQGDASPIRAIQRQSQQNWQRMQQNYQSFQRREQQEMQRHCASNFIGGVRNPVACQRHMQGQQQRQQQFMSQWNRGLQQIQHDSQRVGVLGQQYEEAMREIASMREQRYSSYDDPFGFYANPYDSSYLYNVGGPQFQQNVNMMGPQMMGPQMMGPQMMGPQMMGPQMQGPLMPPQMMMGR